MKSIREDASKWLGRTRVWGREKEGLVIRTNEDRGLESPRQLQKPLSHGFGVGDLSCGGESQMNLEGSSWVKF